MAKSQYCNLAGVGTYFAGQHIADPAVESPVRSGVFSCVSFHRQLARQRGRIRALIPVAGEQGTRGRPDPLYYPVVGHSVYLPHSLEAKGLCYVPIILLDAHLRQLESVC